VASVCWRTIVRVKGYVHLCKNAQPPDPDLCRNVGKPDPEPEVVCIFAQPPPEGEGLLGALFTPRPDPRFRRGHSGERLGRLVDVWV